MRSGSAPYTARRCSTRLCPKQPTSPRRSPTAGPCPSTSRAALRRKRSGGSPRNCWSAWPAPGPPRQGRPPDMGKLDELEHRMGANADDSVTRVPATTAHQDSVVAMPERLKGLVKSRNAAEILVDRIIADPNQPREIFDEESINR